MEARPAAARRRPPRGRAAGLVPGSCCCCGCCCIMVASVLRLVVPLGSVKLFLLLCGSNVALRARARRKEERRRE